MCSLTLKKSNLAVAISLATLASAALSSAAFANTADLEQIGTANQATLTQIGVAQSILATQLNVENQLSATQAGEGSDLITLQDGYQNDAVTWQQGDSNSLALTQLGLFNFADYYLIGSGGSGFILQQGTDNQAVAEIYGDGSVIEIEQFGSDNAADAYIDGDNNGFSAYQSGNLNQSWGMVDFGYDNSITTWQSGQENYSDVTILNRLGSGTDSIDNHIYVVQDGDRNVSNILMRGIGNDVQSYQYGLDNNVDIEQRYYGGTYIFSMQDGSENDLQLEVRGVNNSYSGYQAGNENSVELDMFSNRGDVTVEQGGQFNSLSLLLSNLDNHAYITQFGDSNRVEGLSGGALEMGGSDGLLNVFQNGMGNLVQGIQLSDSSSISVTQIGNMNTAVVAQY
ncbi:MAG: hypothetical protein JJU03_12725 [Idiomarina sp.]|nr:hypothetical protein [Idiomarina sp.]